jgi:hypothetical protein
VLELDDTRGHREHAPVPAGSEKPLGIACVVPRIEHHVDEFFHRVAAGLPGLPLDDVEALLAVREDEVVEAQHDPGAIRQRPRGPGSLGSSKRLHGGLDVRLVRQRQGEEPLPRERSDDVTGGRTCLHAEVLEQTVDERPIDCHDITTISTRWNSLRSL